MSRFLPDTNVPPELTNAQPNKHVEQWLNNANNQDLFLSVISIAEICKSIAKLPESRKRNALQQWLDSTLRPWFEGRILPGNESIAERMGRWAGEGESNRKKIKIADGLIGATAVEYDLTIVTRNVKDFGSFGVAVVNPCEL